MWYDGAPQMAMSRLLLKKMIHYAESLARQPISVTARTHQFPQIGRLLATFMTKPYKGLSGSCCHFHVSLLERGTGNNIFLDPEAEHGISPAAAASFRASSITRVRAWQSGARRRTVIDGSGRAPMPPQYQLGCSGSIGQRACQGEPGQGHAHRDPRAGGAVQPITGGRISHCGGPAWICAAARSDAHR
jgi:hypothetical protein